MSPAAAAADASRGSKRDCCNFSQISTMATRLANFSPRIHACVEGVNSAIGKMLRIGVERNWHVSLAETHVGLCKDVKMRERAVNSAFLKSDGIRPFLWPIFVQPLAPSPGLMHFQSLLRRIVLTSRFVNEFTSKKNIKRFFPEENYSPQGRTII